MKIYSIFTILFISIPILFLSCSDSPEGSKAHQEAVLKSREIKSLYETASDQVEEMREKKDEMLDKIKEDPSSTNNQTKEILNFNQSIAKGEGVIENLKTMVSQHESYIEKHEETALGVADIQAQHNQINEDYFVAKKESAMLQKLYDNLLLEHERMTSNE